MIFTGYRNLAQLLTILCLFNVILALYDTSKIRRYPSATNNQRSAERGYKYAWFTRDIHDDEDVWSTEQDQPLDQSSHQLLRLKLLKSILNRNYPDNDENGFQ